MATPTLLIGGLNCSARLFESQIPMLWRYGPVLVADHRTADTVEQIATDILRGTRRQSSRSPGCHWAASLRSRSCVAVLSGWSAWALLATSARPETDAERDIRLARMELASSGRFLELPPLHFAKNVHPSRQTDDALRAKHRAMTEDVGPHAYLRQQAAIGARPDARPGLTAISCPTVVIVGDSDFITPPSHSKEMAEAIPHSRLVTIQACGHLCTLERPEAVTATLQAWREQAVPRP